MRTRRLLTAACLLLCATSLWAQPSLPSVGLPDSNRNELIELPANATIKGDTRFVIVEAKTRADAVEWLVLNLSEKKKVEAKLMPGGRSILVLPENQEDMIIVLAYVQLDGKLSKAVKHVITVTEDAPPDPKPLPPTPTPPPPTPVPVPINLQLPLHITIVTDFNKQTPEIAAVINDANLRKSIQDAGFKFHNVSIQSKSVTAGGLNIGVQKAGGAPCVIIQDARGVILSQAPVVNTASVVQLIEKTLGK